VKSKPLELKVVGNCSIAPPGAAKMKPELVAAAEIAVTFGGFKNIDLFSQGIYQIRVRASTERTKRQCLPYAFAQGAGRPHPSDGSYLPAHILEDTADFCMPAFRVRYCEQEIRMETVVRMRADLSVEALRSPRSGPAADAPTAMVELDPTDVDNFQPALEMVRRMLRASGAALTRLGPRSHTPLPTLGDGPGQRCSASTFTLCRSTSSIHSATIPSSSPRTGAARGAPNARALVDEPGRLR